MDKETVRPSQLQSFLEHKKPKDKHAQDYYYKQRFDERYHDEDYYEKHNNEGLKFNPKLDILEFEGRRHADDFLDWLNTVESILDSINAYKVELPDDYNILPTFQCQGFKALSW